MTDGAEALVVQRFRVGRELRALHADVGSAVAARRCSSASAASATRLRSTARGRMRERHMRDAAGPEEAGLALERAVDELIGQHEQAGIEFALVGAAGGDGDDVGDAGALQRVDIGAVVDRRGREAVAAAVTGEEHHLRVADAAETQRVGRLAPGRRRRAPRASA